MACTLCCSLSLSFPSKCGGIVLWNSGSCSGGYRGALSLIGIPKYGTDYSVYPIRLDTAFHLYTVRPVNKLWREVTDMLDSCEHEAWKLCYPHKINAPGGYASPRFYAPTIFSHVALFTDPDRMSERSHIPEALAMAGCKLMQRGVPTYFLATELADAVAHMKLPDGFTAAQIAWPLDALLFVLPEKFSRRYFGRYVAFVTAAHAEPGVYPRQALNSAMIKQFGLRIGHELVNTVPRTVVSGVAVPDNPAETPDACSPADYSSDFPDTFEINRLMEMPYEDLTVYDGAHMTAAPTAGTPADADMANIITTFTIKLLVVLGARSGLIKQGTVARPQRIKHGREVQSELWNPTIIGSTYRVSRSNSAPPTGTHASPRMHWRWGHFTHQFIGKRKGEDFVPTAGLPRKDDGNIDWGKVTDEQRIAFWKNHKIKMIDPILVNAPKDVAK